VFGSQAHAIATAVQFSTDGGGDGTDGSYEVTGITEFDWQSTGDLVIIDGSVNEMVDGTNYTSFSAWLGAATTDILTGGATSHEVTYDLEAHSRLGEFLNGGGGVDSFGAEGVLDTNGTGTNGGVADVGYEITAALEATETATLTVTVDDNGTPLDFSDDIITQTLTFSAISGTYAYYYDATPDSDVAAGTGFVNGTEFLSGSITGVVGDAVFEFDALGNLLGFGGDNILTNTVDAYNVAYIQADPDSNAPLSGTTFDTLISVVSSTDFSGDVIGKTPYSVTAADLVLKADANTEFEASPNQIPAPQTLLLFGIGLLGLRLTARKG